MQILSLIVQVTNTVVFQKMIVLHNIVLIQKMLLLDQKKKIHKMLVIDSDTESENEIHSAGEDHTGASGVTVECNNLQNDNEITELVFGWPK